MTYYDEDFYREPSEFEQQIDEFKETLINSIKENFKSEMEQLRKENFELQAIKKNMDQIKREFENKERQFDNDRKNMEQTVRRERLASLMKDFKLIMFRADYKSVMPPKCDNCNEKRRVPFISPLGRETEEDCDCKFTNRVYFPAEYIAHSFKINSENGNEMMIWYKMNPERDYDHAAYDSSELAKSIYKEGDDYNENRYKTYFLTQEDCQKYCDWLTERDKNSKQLGYL